MNLVSEIPGVVHKNELNLLRTWLTVYHFYLIQVKEKGVMEEAERRLKG